MTSPDCRGHKVGEVEIDPMGFPSCSLYSLLAPGFRSDMTCCRLARTNSARSQCSFLNEKLHAKLKVVISQSKPFCGVLSGRVDRPQPTSRGTSHTLTRNGARARFVFLQRSRSLKRKISSLAAAFILLSPCRSRALSSLNIEHKSLSEIAEADREVCRTSRRRRY